MSWSSTGIFIGSQPSRCTIVSSVRYMCLMRPAPDKRLNLAARVVHLSKGHLMWTGLILALPALPFWLGFRLPAPAADCRHLPRPVATRAAPNDNRAAAGVLNGGVLTVRLAPLAAAW